MKCIRCGHIQNDTYQCESCRFVFNKKLKQAGQEDQPFFHTNVGKIVIGATIAGILIFFLVGRQPRHELGPISAPATDDDLQRTPDPKAAHRKTKRSKNNLAKQLQLSSPPKNNIERARNATVFIKTSWGVGSGFFISSDCKILTNRHVVEYNKEKLAALETSIQLQRNAIAAEELQLAARKTKFQNECQDCSKEAFDQNVGALSDNYYATIEKIDRAKRQLTEKANRQHLTALFRIIGKCNLFITYNYNPSSITYNFKLIGYAFFCKKISSEI